MSGSHKFTDAEIAEWKQKILDARRQRQAELEQQRREAAEAAERQRQFATTHRQIQQQLQTLLSDLYWYWANLDSQDATALQYHCQQQQDLLAQAESETQLFALADKLVCIERAMQTALYRRRRDEIEKQRRAEIEQQQFVLQELEQRTAQIPVEQATAFDAAGHQQVQAVLQTIKDAITVGNPVAVRHPLAKATAMVQKHLRQVGQRSQDQRQIQAKAHQHLSELQVIVAGLKADPVAMCWQATAIEALENQMRQAQHAMATGQFATVVSELANLNQHRQTILEIANTAQKQAQRRDYIADSIGQALQNLGFDLTFRQLEHPDHPASAIILGATTHTGKGVGVSVPIAGQVFYDVDGYTQHSVTTVEGNTATVCDEAEQMLMAMHATLEHQFGVKMGAVLWPGKAPHRSLHQATPHPQGQPTHHRSQVR